LIRVRAEHLRFADETLDDVIADLRHWRTAIRTQDYDELVLWYEHDLFDQLNLVQVLSELGEWRLNRPVSLVSIDAYPGHPVFKGIGELAPRDVEELFTRRASVGGQQIALAARAWQSFRADDPRLLEQFLATDTSALPYLAAALRRHLEEFPGAHDGLSSTERTLMALARDGDADLHRLLPRMHDGERAFYITDTGLFESARTLAQALPPLLTLRAEDHGLMRSLPKGEVAISQAGRDVLNGSADRVRLCGIDRWLGGVHLSGRGPTWRWGVDRQALTRG
jgi:hypothetical protein